MGDRRRYEVDASHGPMSTLPSHTFNQPRNLQEDNQEEPVDESAPGVNVSETAHTSQLSQINAETSYLSRSLNGNGIGRQSPPDLPTDKDRPRRQHIDLLDDLDPVDILLSDQEDLIEKGDANKMKDSLFQPFQGEGNSIDPSHREASFSHQEDILNDVGNDAINGSDTIVTSLLHKKQGQSLISTSAGNQAYLASRRKSQQGIFSPTNHLPLQMPQRTEFYDEKKTSPSVATEPLSDFSRKDKDADSSSKSPRTLLDEEMDSKPPSSSGSFPQNPLVTGSLEATKEMVITQALKPSPQEPRNEISDDIGNGRDNLQRILSPLPSASRKRSLDNNLVDNMMDKATMDKKLERIRNDIHACNKLKLKLYMEAMRVHKGNGEDRKYADYWHAISRYLSTTGMIRSCSDMDINGIEKIFESFLKTKKMKKLHNAFVKSIMKQILETDASRLQIGEHVPIKWRKKLRYPEVSPSTKGINSQPTDLEGIDSVKEVFISDTEGSGKTGRNVFWGSSVSKIPIVNIDASDTISQDDFGVSSSRLPGIMEIDHISRYAAETEGYCLSQSAQWITSIAVKDYISNILRDTITHIDDEDRKGDRKRKRKRLTNYDIARAMESSVSQLSAEKGKHASLPASRIAWERIVGNSCLTFVNGVTPELEKFQTKMNTLIDNEIDRRSNSIMNKSNFRESRFGSKNLSSMSTRRSVGDSTSEFANMPSSREMLGVQMALNPNQPALWTAPAPSHPSSSAPSQNRNVLPTNGQNIDAEALYSAMRQRGSFLSESIGADVSRMSTPQQSGMEGAQVVQEGPNPSLAFGVNNLAGAPFATAQPMLPQNNQFGALALPENGETIPFQQLNDIMGSQRPNSESANIRQSSNTAMRNMGGGRGKGSKDLSAMLARNMARD